MADKRVTTAECKQKNWIFLNDDAAYCLEDGSILLAVTEKFQEPIDEMINIIGEING